MEAYHCNLDLAVIELGYFEPPPVIPPGYAERAAEIEREVCSYEAWLESYLDTTCGDDGDLYKQKMRKLMIRRAKVEGEKMLAFLAEIENWKTQ